MSGHAAVPERDTRPVALLYRRVSTDEQAREGLSLKAQATHTRRYAVVRGWSIGGEYEDVLSGTRADRPSYQSLLAEAKRLRANGRAVVVIVKWLDRFGRSVFERARCADELRRSGVPVHSVMEGGEVPELVANLLAAVAEEEVRRLGARLGETRKYVMVAGWHYPTRAAWGYLRRPATGAERSLGAPRTVLDIDPAQEPYLREAWRRADAGDSVQSIARWVQSLPAEVRGARYMSYPCVRRMLSAAVYVARTAQGVPDVLSRPVMRWPALIEEDRWSRVQERFRNRPRRPPREPRVYLLVGLLQCPSCGASMRGQFQTRQASQYCCFGRAAGAGAPDMTCHMSATMPLVDALVILRARQLVEAVDAILGAGAESYSAWQAIARADDGGDDPRAPELTDQADQARRRWTSAAVAYVDGRYGKARYERLREEALADLEAVEAERQRVAARVQQEVLPEAEYLAGRASAWKVILEGEDILAKRQVLDELVKTIVPFRVRRGEYDADIRWTPLALAMGRLAPDHRSRVVDLKPCTDPRCAPQGPHPEAARHCKHRHHLYDEAHTVLYPSHPSGRCLTCEQEKNALAREKRRAAANLRKVSAEVADAGSALSSRPSP